jgi:probable F420-dependent oxidoreductase
VDIGYLGLNDAGGIRPDHLAAELEDRGYESLWLPEHSHIPTSRKTPYPAGGDLPEGYWRMMDPLVSLGLAAGATTSRRLGTGICLLLEHDLLDLACATATLDVLSGGRLRLGVGVGWNEEELANHRPDVPFSQRYSAMRERVSALRAAWGQEAASFEGRWDRFDEAWVYPKPVQGSIPVLLGNAGPLGIEHAATYADEWCPIDASVLNTTGRPDVPGGIALFREKAAEHGRDPDSIPITIFAMGRLNIDRLRSYGDLGVHRVVLPPPSMELHSADDTRRHLDGFTAVLEALT